MLRDQIRRARLAVAPDRDVTTAIALRLAMVSSSDSSLAVELRAMSRLNTSALRRLARDLEGGAGAGAVLGTG